MKEYKIAFHSFRGDRFDEEQFYCDDLAQKGWTFEGIMASNGLLSYTLWSKEKQP